jgi:hypothetical protein
LAASAFGGSCRLPKWSLTYGLAAVRGLSLDDSANNIDDLEATYVADRAPPFSLVQREGREQAMLPLAWRDVL